MDWVKQIELRSHARVPIISFVHKNCIGCDVSLGMQSKHTTDLVTQMRDRSGRDFVPLSVFLKMFLTLQELDQPFTGGIGSFKLYAMVAFIIDKYNRKQVQSHTSSSSSSSRGRHDREQSHQSLGRILLEFFSYFGQRKNLNLSTVIQIYDTEVTFDANRKVDMCQGTFQQAYLALSIAIGKQERGESHISVVRNSYTISNSLLGLIINTEELQRRREESLRSCRLYPARNELDRCMVATKLLSELNKLTVPKPPVALEDVRSRRPFLMTLLRSFPSVPLALKSVKSSQIRLHSSNSDSGGGSNNNYNKSSGRQSSDNYKKNDRFTSSEYENNNSYMHENSRTGMKRKVATFSRGGVVGSSFQNNNGGGNSAQKSKKKRSSSFKSPSVSSNGSRTPSISSAVAKEQKLRKKLMEKMKERSRK